MFPRLLIGSRTWKCHEKHNQEEIWQSDSMNWYRNKMSKIEYEDIDFCKNCNSYIYQKDKTWPKLQR